jgi:hypothetical protein
MHAITYVTLRKHSSFKSTHTHTHVRDSTLTRLQAKSGTVTAEQELIKVINTQGAPLRSTPPPNLPIVGGGPADAGTSCTAAAAGVPSIGSITPALLGGMCCAGSVAPLLLEPPEVCVLCV